MVLRVFLARGFDPAGVWGLLLCVRVVGEVVGVVWDDEKRNWRMAQWVRGLTGDFDMRVRILRWANCFGVYGSGGEDGWTCLLCRGTKFVHGSVG